jgi:integrase
MRVTSEGPARITRATIDAVWRRRKPDHRLIIRDLECRGLALIVNATSMTWTYAYRPRGTDPITGGRFPNRTISIGNPATHSPEDARNEGNRIKGQAVAGSDPAAERKASAAKVRRERAVTLSRLIDDYATAFARRPKMRGTGSPSPSYVKEEVAQVRMALANMDAKDTPAAALTTADVRRLVDSTEINVRARFAALSKFLDWCQDVGHIQINPCIAVPRARRPRAPQSRERYLLPADLGRLWKASASLREPVWRDLVRFLIAVPCRRTEAARLDWSHLDVAAAEWRQHGKITKNRDPHRLYLHPLALDVLRVRHDATGGKGKGLVFPAPKSGKPVDTFTDIKADLGEAAQREVAKEGGEHAGKLDGWTWHDFRRSFATALGEAGIPEMVADAILNHRQSATRGGVLGVYQRASRWPEQVKAMEHWGGLLAAALNPGEADAKVVPMTARTG